MVAAVEAIQTELAGVVGEGAVSADPEACRALAVDGVQPKLVVYPSSAEQVAAALQCASERDLAVIPIRNGTKLGVGNPPRRYDLALSLKSLNRVWHYEPADLTVAVEPGMKLGDFQHFLARDGLWLPLDPRGGAGASLGGILAANAAGPLRARYGAPRDWTLGMKVATTEGKIIKTGGRVVKNVAGYDVGKLLIGSWGTLGVIVEACFKLFTRPAGRATFVFAVPNLEAARDLRRAIFRSPLEPLRMALLERRAAQWVVEAGKKLEAPNSKLENRSSNIQLRDSSFEFWIEAGGSERVLGRTASDLEHLAGEAGLRAEKCDNATSVWDRVGDFATLAAENSKDAIVLRAPLPLDSSEKFLGVALDEIQVQTFLSQPGTGVVTLVLGGDGAGGNSPASAPSVVARLRDLADKLGGALVVEHCPPELKPQLDVWGRPGSHVEILRQVKAVWDPKGVLSPGRFAGGI